jgi:hypothetical protein
LQVILFGLPEIDVDDWQNNTQYKRCTAQVKQIDWFWQVVRRFDNERRVRLLQFVTGTSRVPMGGFRELQGA